MDSQTVVIFGASSAAVKVAEIFQNLSIDFLYFVDNDAKKWNTIIQNHPVFSPDKLRGGNAHIVIASEYQEEIESQLEEMGISHRLIPKEQLILEQLFKQTKKALSALTPPSFQPNTTVVLELADAGICLGGIETWTLQVIRGLKKREIPVTLFSKQTKDSIPDDLYDVTMLFHLEYTRYKESILELMQALIARMPCIVITNWQSQVMIAAILLKEYFPGKIKLLSVVHNDKRSLYRRQAFLAPYIDWIMGVSKKINQTMLEQFQVPKEKLCYKESPVILQKFERVYTLERKNPLQIGFACRITCFQKRADLLIPLVIRLKELGVSFQLRIAGDGNYIETLSTAIQQYSLQKELLLYGRISRNAMPDFWKTSDIFLSLSDFEGMSLSMLEALSFGAVPVVTRVSGVEEFICNKINGFVCNTQDIEGIAESIVYLDKNRSLLPLFGSRIQKEVSQKCRLDDYLDYLLSLMDLKERGERNAQGISGYSCI